MPRAEDPIPAPNGFVMAANTDAVHILETVGKDLVATGVFAWGDPWFEEVCDAFRVFRE